MVAVQGDDEGNVRSGAVGGTFMVVYLVRFVEARADGGCQGGFAAARYAADGDQETLGIVAFL